MDWLIAVFDIIFTHKVWEVSDTAARSNLKPLRPKLSVTFYEDSDTCMDISFGYPSAQLADYR